MAKKGNEFINFKEDLTISDLFYHFREKYGNEFFDLLWDKKNREELSSMLSIIINGRSYRDDNFLKTILKDGDDISFIYIFFGG